MTKVNPSNGNETKSALYKKRSFPLRISSVNVTKSAGNWDLVTFTEEILSGILYFLCSADIFPWDINLISFSIGHKILKYFNDFL